MTENTVFARDWEWGKTIDLKWVWGKFGGYINLLYLDFKINDETIHIC